jgi:hypothetical protein
LIIFSSVFIYNLDFLVHPRRHRYCLQPEVFVETKTMIQQVRLLGHVAWKKVHMKFGKETQKMLLGKPRHGWEGSIKIDFQETGWQSLGWI